MKPKTIPGRPPKECVDCAALPALTPGEWSELLENVTEWRPKIWRPTNHAPRSPRCATHQRGTHKAAKAQRQATYQVGTYGLAPEVHAALLEIQDHRCWICRKPSKVRALASDHDHNCCPGDTSCGECVRGKLCRRCNYDLIGMYSIEQLLTAISYLQGNTPMALLRQRLEQAS